MTTKLERHSNVQSEITALLDRYDHKSKKLPFQRSRLGGSGVTFLPMDSRFHFVLKWQSRIRAEMEYVSTEFYRRSFQNLSIPNVQYNPQLKSIFFNFFTKKKTEFVIPSHELVLIEYKQGNTLNAFCRNGNFFTLPQEELDSLFTQFGEISGYDFLIGNSDRFIPRGFQGEIMPNHTANGGNVLIELARWRHTDPSKVRVVHVIDNGPDFFAFFEHKERPETEVEEESEDFDLSLFGADDTPLEAVEESPSASALLSGEDLRRKKREEFEYYKNANPENIKLIAEQILIGIKNLIQEELIEQSAEVDEFFDERPFLIESLIKGLQKARKSLLRPKIQSVLEDLKKESATMHPSLQIFLDFVQANLKIKGGPSINPVEQYAENIIDALAAIDIYDHSANLASSPSQVSATNPHRFLLDSIRADLFHFDLEKKQRIIFKIQEMLKDPLAKDDPEFMIVLERILEVVENFQHNQTVLITPTKPSKQKEEKTNKAACSRSLSF